MTDLREWQPCNSAPYVHPESALKDQNGVFLIFKDDINYEKHFFSIRQPGDNFVTLTMFVQRQRCFTFREIEQCVLTQIFW